MSSTENGSTALQGKERRDPRMVGLGLVVIIGVLALAFPKPDKAPPVPIDPVDVPAGFTRHSLADASVSSCIKGAEPQEACKLLGVSDQERVSLTVSWEQPMGEKFEPGTPIEVTNARLLLIENHQDDYQGVLSLVDTAITGERMDLRTFRFPPDGHSDDLNALLAAQLSDNALTLSFAPLAEEPSSIDEFTPSLEFAWRVVA